GLNLTWETLEGIVKHNGPLVDPAGRPCGRYAERGVPAAIRSYVVRHDLELANHAGAEAQVAAIADDIAYDAHDMDDGLRAELSRLDDRAGVATVGDVLATLRARYRDLEAPRLVHELIRRVIARMIEDVIAESAHRLVVLGPQSAQEVRAAAATVIGFSPAMAQVDVAIKGFLYPHMYRHPRVADIMQ